MTSPTPSEMIREMLDKGLTQSQIAFEAKVSQPTINRILANRFNPSFPTLTGIQAAYHRHLASSDKGAATSSAGESMYASG